MQFRGTYGESLQESQAAIDGIEDNVLYFIPGTRLLYYGDESAAWRFIDKEAHGSLASTQIGCDGFAFGSETFVLAINYIDGFPQSVPKLVDWVAQQPFVDVVHLNMQDIPQPQQFDAQSQRAIGDLIATGKAVVVAAGNGIGGQWANYPMELSQFNGPAGSLVIGACDQDGWTLYSNLDPHVCPDGGATQAGEATGYGATSFDGTSSSSPRAAGYVAELLARVRAELGVPTGMSGGSLVDARGVAVPTQGPLGDGLLTFAELHEVVRRTADADLGPSALDGDQSGFYVPASPSAETAYAKAGYGKLTEATLAAALEAIMGRTALPERPTEDQYYETSEAIREAYWG
ncbi:MAG: S8 family serine peptidase [Thermoplasmatota archaeon]